MDAEGPGIGSPIDVAARVFRNLSDLHDASPAIINAAADNPDLSKTGKGKARKTAGEAQLAAMAKLQDEAKTVITSALNKARAKRPERTAEEIAERISLAAETRRWLFEAHGQDALMLETTLREAEANADVATLDAVLKAPPSWPLARSFDKEDWTRRRAALADNDLGPEAVALVQAQADLTARFQWVGDAVKQDAGIPLDGISIEEIANADVADTA